MNSDPLDRLELPVIVRWDSVRNRWCIQGPGIKGRLSTIVELTKPRRAQDGAYHGFFVRTWVPWPNHREWRVAGPNDRLGDRLVLEGPVVYTRQDPS